MLLARGTPLPLNIPLKTSSAVGPRRTPSMHRIWRIHAVPPRMHARGSIFASNASGHRYAGGFVPRAHVHVSGLGAAGRVRIVNRMELGPHAHNDRENTLSRHDKHAGRSAATTCTLCTIHHVPRMQPRAGRLPHARRVLAVRAVLP